MTAKHLIISILSLSVLIGWNSQASAAQPGKVQVVSVDGTATVSGTNGADSKPLTAGAAVQEGQRIVTSSDSRVVLLFDNGSIFTVNENSSFDIQQFLVEPFNIEKVNYNKITKEPSQSQTKVKVNKGTVLADIRKLNRSSKMDIATPVGVAGIRGTKVKVTVSQNANGSFNVNFSVPEGTISVNAPNGQTYTVGEGAQASPSGGPTNSLSFTAQVNPTTGEITIVGPAVPSTLTPAQVQAITSDIAASESAVTVADPSGTFRTTQDGAGVQAPPATSGAAGGSGGGGSGDQGAINNTTFSTNPTPTPTPAPTPTPFPPNPS